MSMPLVCTGVRYDAKPRQFPRLIVGISGASGAIYGARLLELLRPLPVETHLVDQPRGRGDAGARNRSEAGCGSRPRRCRARDRRHGGADLVRLVPDDRHGRRALLDPQHGGDRQRRDHDPVDPGRGRGAEGTPPAGARGARDPAPHRAFADDDRAVRDGRGDRPAGAGLLRQAADDRRDGRPDPRPRPRLCSGSTPARRCRAALRARNRGEKS